MMLAMMSGQVSTVGMGLSWVVRPLIQCDQYPCAKGRLAQVGSVQEIRGMRSPMQRHPSPLRGLEGSPQESTACLWLDLRLPGSGTVEVTQLSVELDAQTLLRSPKTEQVHPCIGPPRSGEVVAQGHLLL